MFELIAAVIAVACIIAVLLWPHSNAWVGHTDSNVRKRSFPEDREKIRSGGSGTAPPSDQLAKEYEVAVQMMVYESNHFWAAFGAFLLAASLLATLLAGGSTPTQNASHAVFAMVGLALCRFWWAVGKRCQAYVGLRIGQARELETLLCGTIFDTGRVFAEGRDVRFKDQDEAIRVVGAARHLGIREVALLLPWIFAILFAYVVVIRAVAIFN